jgi:hypothetical protein
LLLLRRGEFCFILLPSAIFSNTFIVICAQKRQEMPSKYCCFVPIFKFAEKDFRFVWHLRAVLWKLRQARPRNDQNKFPKLYGIVPQSAIQALLNPDFCKSDLWCSSVASPNPRRQCDVHSNCQTSPFSRIFGRMNYTNLPDYLLSILTAAWFAVMAYKFKKSILLWCITGAIVGLSISAICLGLAHAATLPYTPFDFRRTQSLGITITVVVIGVSSAVVGLVNRNRINRPSRKV